MFKDFLLVGLGSFMGGGARFLIAKWAQTLVAGAFPLGTFLVNILGCLLIGFLSGLPLQAGWLSPSSRLVLATGFCCGFTTFSTFMNENMTLLKDANYMLLFGYLLASLAVGFVGVVIGSQLAGWMKA